jgi:Tetracyclin repressor-like, C-terminal domain
LTQPGLIALTVSRQMIGPNALRLREDMLTLLRRGALDDADAVSAYFALFAYTTGFVAFETGRTPGKADTEQRAQTYRLHASLPDEEFPQHPRPCPTPSQAPGRCRVHARLIALIAGFADTAQGA